MYNKRVRLVCLANDPAETIFSSDLDKGVYDEIFAWERCSSRLVQMQSKEYLDHHALASQGLLGRSFESMDTGGDGKISFDEFLFANKDLSEDDARLLFNQIDIDCDGFLRPDEFEKFVEKAKESGVG